MMRTTVVAEYSSSLCFICKSYLLLLCAVECVKCVKVWLTLFVAFARIHFINNPQSERPSLAC